MFHKCISKIFKPVLNIRISLWAITVSFNTLTFMCVLRFVSDVFRTESVFTLGLDCSRVTTLFLNDSASCIYSSNARFIQDNAVTVWALSNTQLLGLNTKANCVVVAAWRMGTLAHQSGWKGKGAGLSIGVEKGIDKQYICLLHLLNLSVKWTANNKKRWKSV